jgi:hypothetical protein
MDRPPPTGHRPGIRGGGLLKHSGAELPFLRPSPGVQRIAQHFLLSPLGAGGSGAFSESPMAERMGRGIP